MKKPAATFSSSSGHEVTPMNGLFRPQDCNRLVVCLMVVQVVVFRLLVISKLLWVSNAFHSLTWSNQFCLWWWSVALQPRPGLGLRYGFHDSLYSTMWGYQLHDRPVLDTLIQTSETSSNHYQRLSWRSRETQVRNGRWILPTSTYLARRVLLYAVNLRHGTDDFTPLRRRRATDFITLKIHRPRPCLNPRTLGPVASTLTTRPPRATVLFILTLIYFLLGPCRVLLKYRHLLFHGVIILRNGQTQWLCSLRRTLSSISQTVELRVLILVDTWLYIRVYLSYPP
jgi:hypothetical protein